MSSCLLFKVWGQRWPIASVLWVSGGERLCRSILMVSDYPRRLCMTDMNLVWQIAQRDYRFGKGKHSSLTKATYDAVANKFRSLWGKEAGWAHSVLFTADLKAFSERLVAKVETKDEKVAIKSEPKGPAIEETTVEKKAVSKRVKREPEEEHSVLEVKEKETKRVRRTTRSSREY